MRHDQILDEATVQILRAFALAIYATNVDLVEGAEKIGDKFLENLVVAPTGERQNEDKTTWRSQPIFTHSTHFVKRVDKASAAHCAVPYGNPNPSTSSTSVLLTNLLRRGFTHR